MNLRVLRNNHIMHVKGALEASYSHFFAALLLPAFLAPPFLAPPFLAPPFLATLDLLDFLAGAAAAPPAAAFGALFLIDFDLLADLFPAFALDLPPATLVFAIV